MSCPMVPCPGEDSDHTCMWKEFLKQPCSEPATFSAWQSSAPDPYDHTLAYDVHIGYMLDVWDQPFPFDQEEFQRERGGETALCCWLGESAS